MCMHLLMTPGGAGERVWNQYLHINIFLAVNSSIHPYNNHSYSFKVIFVLCECKLDELKVMDT